MDNVTFDLRSAERIARSVKFTERQAEDLTGGRGRFIRVNDAPFFYAQITSSTAVTGNTNQWTYAFQEVTNSGTTAGTVQNTWSALAGGVTGTAINLAEAANVTTGTGNTAPTAVLSTGWNSTNFGATTNLAAIPNNSIVMVSSTLDNATPPNMVYTFFAANVVQGGC